MRPRTIRRERGETPQQRPAAPSRRAWTQIPINLREKLLPPEDSRPHPASRAAAERGKWKAVNVWLSPGSHDAPVPSRADLKTARGDLRAFHRAYIKPE